MTLILENIEIYAYHGCLPEERLIGSLYRITIEIDYDATLALQTDDLNHAVDYQKIYQIVVDEMSIPSNLLEHVAFRLKNKIKKSYPQINDVRLKISKMNPPIGGTITAVTCVI